MAADAVTGEFGANQELTRITGTGHASLEQTNANGAHQLTQGERIEARLVPPDAPRNAAKSNPKSSPKSSQTDTIGQIQSATVDGNVVLTQDQPAKPGQPAQPPLKATAGHVLYDGASEWLRLTQSPRIDNAALQLSADKLDVAQATGDAMAHGNVKATWLQPANETGKPGSQSALGLGGQGPAHVVADEARLQRSSNQATFRGHARLWQQANSISAPEIVLDQTRQTLVAHSSGAAQPVELVLLSAGGLTPSGQTKPANASPSVTTVRAGDLKYSAAERKTLLHAGAAGPVLAETATATTSSNEVEIVQLPPGNHAGPDGGAAQLDRLIARGHVVVTSGGRRGTGEQLVYSSETGNYTLTGTAAAPPRMTDPAHGSVTGEALIFNTRDDSVSIEGQGQKTLTQTVAPK
jgi:lipopolysaccharide export system protein LptA